METRANHLLIGVFVLAALVAGLGFLYWVGGIEDARARNRYVLQFDGPVQGLTPAADVLFNGLKVGQIGEIGIDPEDTRRVRVVVELEPGTPVRANSRAMLLQHGFTGLASIGITPGTPDATIIAGAETGSLPEIRTDPVLGATSLLESGAEIAASANAAFRRINDLIGDNEQSIRSAIRGLEAFAAMLEQNRGDITAIIANVRGFSDQLSRLTELIATAERTLARIDGVIVRNEGAIDRSIENVSLFTGVLAEKREDVGVVIANVRDVSGELITLAGKLDSTLEGVSGLFGAEGDRSLLVEAREAVGAFRALAMKLEADLAGGGGVTEQARRGLKEFELFMREGRRAAGSLERVLDRVERQPQSLLFGGRQVPAYTPE